MISFPFLKTGTSALFVGALLCSSAMADTVKRTIVPANQQVNMIAQTLPKHQRDDFMLGVFNLIFTHQPKHGDAVMSYVLATYSTPQIIAQGRAVQAGTN